MIGPRRKRRFRRIVARTLATISSLIARLGLTPHRMSFNSVQDPEVDALAQQLASLKRVTKTEAADGAIEAFARFGKGRYPAGLNFGNCFAYACARACRMPLLFKGNDLPLTDITAT